jgi:hypothetical protein
MSDASASGYVLLAPQQSTYTYLLDASGAVVHTWKSAYTAGLTAVLTEDGHLLRAGKVGEQSMHGSGGVIEEYDWDGNLLWQYYVASDSEFQHHDFTQLPNGDILMTVAEVLPAGEAIAAGRDPGQLRDGHFVADKLVEVRPEGLHGGEVVWEWRAIDHVVQDIDPAAANYGVVAEHPERIDINYQGRTIFPDGWTHINAVDYDADTDTILVSSRNYNELWIIDHSTSTAEAAGHSGGNAGKGGDLLWRYGNPQASDAGDASSQTLFGQHDAKWIDDGLPGAGHILVFDNGVDRPEGQYSRVLEIALPDGAAGLAGAGATGNAGEIVWSYVATPPEALYSDKMGGAQRLPNGNTLITDGDSGQVFQVTPAGLPVRGYAPDLAVLEGAVLRTDAATFYATWYPGDSAALDGQSLLPENQTIGALARRSTTLFTDALTAALRPAQSPFLAAGMPL